jgi:hypothetical protein
MSQKVFVKLEKKLACDLKPGELFIMEEPSGFERALNIGDVGVVLMLRTNYNGEIDDPDVTVHKVHIVIVDREDPGPPKVDPHNPPGMH